MKRLRWMFAWPALLVVTSGLVSAAQIRDQAGMFGPETVSKANSELDRIEREYSVPIMFETIESLNGKTLDRAFRERAEALNDKGIFILVARRDKKTQVAANAAYIRYVTDSRMQSVREAMDGEFRKGNFDAGLLASIKTLDATLAEARADAGGSLKSATPPARRAADAPAPARRPAARSSSWGAGSLITIVLMILAALLVFRIIGSLFSAARGGGGYGPGYGAPNRMGGPGYGGPGYGGPGYGGGGGGGGFMSSLFGGIGGAMAGNWLYDRMTGGHHGGTYTDQAGYGAGAGADPSVTDQTAATGWERPLDGGDDWGASNTADAGNAGGDWGGTGGGDWGGGDGGGGGDWGGGASDGGGDWGGGNDNGGSW